MNTNNNTSNNIQHERIPIHFYTQMPFSDTAKFVQLPSKKTRLILEDVFGTGIYYYGLDYPCKAYYKADMYIAGWFKINRTQGKWKPMYLGKSIKQIKELGDQIYKDFYCGVFKDTEKENNSHEQ